MIGTRQAHDHDQTAGSPSSGATGGIAAVMSGDLGANDSGVRIRTVAAGDLTPLIALWREVFPEYNDPQRPQPQLDAQLVGSAMAGYDGHRGWLYSVGVLPRLRRSGLARALVTRAEAELARRGCPKINLQVLASNDDGRNFWRALGYVDDAVVSLGKRLG